MYSRQKGLRRLFAGMQLASVCAIAIALATPIARAQGGCDPPPSGTMVAWYTFDELAGPTSFDIAGGNMATWVSTPPPTPGPGEVLGGLNFNGNSYADAPSTIITNFGPAGGATCGGGNFSTCQGNFSIDVWVNLNAAVQGVETIVDKRDTTPIGYSFYLYRNTFYSNNTYIGLQLADASGYTNYFSKPLTPVQFTANAWYHLAVTVKRSSTPTPVIKWYLNGTLTHPNSAPTQIGTLVNKAQLRIGANGPYDGPINFFNGTLDELEIFNRVLTTAEVNAIWGAWSAGKCKP
jgi:Concanavalin A-like lectin/glucanases superfamily